jgi:hypothetical protein
VHLFLGELDQACRWVDTAFEVKDTMVPWICIDPIPILFAVSGAASEAQPARVMKLVHQGDL